MGRPKRSARKDIKKAALQVLLTERESAYIDQFAEEEMVTRSGYGRRVIVEHITRRLVESADSANGDPRN